MDDIIRVRALRPSSPDSAIRAAATGELALAGRRYRCALGRSGIARQKIEGDGATPAGNFPLRRIYYRADRLPRPDTRLPVAAIAPDDAWCDDPENAAYNRPVKLPYPARHERLWREDGLYDLVVVIGYNDDPAIPGAGSAIFIHIAKPGFAPTEGCVALAPADLLEILRFLSPKARIEIEADDQSPRA